MTHPSRGLLNATWKVWRVGYR